MNRNTVDYLEVEFFLVVVIILGSHHERIYSNKSLTRWYRWPSGFGQNYAR